MMQPLFRKQPLLIAGMIFAGLLSGTGPMPYAVRPEVRIGVINYLPFEYVDGQRYGGIIVDLITEAARRRGISVRWIPIEGSADTALATGKVDLWPLLGATRMRRQNFYLTDSWIQRPYCLFSPQSSPLAGIEATPNRDIGYLDRPLPLEDAPKYLREARLHSFPTDSGLVAAVCRGEVAAGFMEVRRTVQALMIQPSECAGRPLKLVYVKGASASASIVAVPAFAREADAIRAEISRLLLDGEFDSMLEKVDAAAAEDLRSVFSLEQSRLRSRFYVFGFFTVSLLCVLTTVGATAAWQFWRNADAARLYEKIRSDALRRLAAGEHPQPILDTLRSDFMRRFPELVVRFIVDPPETSLPAAGSGWKRIAVTADAVHLGEIHILGRYRRGALQEIQALTGLTAVILNHARLREQLRREATTDRLTGLANRHHLAQEFPLMVRSAAMSGQRVAVFSVDIDRFKHVNDAFGHPVGDSYLSEIAQRLRRLFPDGSLIARTGGDEFTVIVQGLSLAEVQSLAKAAVAALHETALIGGHEIPVSATIGISSFPDNGKAAEDLLQSADVALYQAKHAGRNRYQMSVSGPQSLLSDRLQIERLLRRAIERGENFEIVY
jgi:diguanylate cyclase (GGDEF)-like protein